MSILSWLFGKQPRTATVEKRARPELESLEAREVPAANVYLVPTGSGVPLIQIDGDGNKNVATVNYTAGGAVKVTLDLYNAANVYQSTLQAEYIGSIDSIRYDALGGNDVFWN